MQKPKSLEQIANELAAKREPIKMEPKPKNTGGIDLSRAAGAIKEQQKQNLAQKSRIPSQNLAQNSKIPSQKPQLNSEQNTRNSRISSQNLAQKPEPKVELKPEPKPEKIVMRFMSYLLYN